MRPKSLAETGSQGDLFRAHLDQVLNREHPLCVLANQMDWSIFEQEFGPLYVEGFGRPGLPIRLVVGLHYLKYAYNESDESVVERFLENPYWQYFCGFEYFQHEFPLDPSSLVRWRRRVGSKGMEKLLKETVETAKREGLMKARHLERVNVDTTVQEKAVAFPTDARLYHKMRRVLVRVAKREGIELRQSFERLSKRALQMQGRYSHARQMKRAKRETKKLRVYLGRVLRDLQRKCPNAGGVWQHLFSIANRIMGQQRADHHKVYSIHAPEVECISKGKVHKRYEFGCKVAVVSTSKENWVVGVGAIHGNPYDGHTLEQSIEQTERVTGWRPSDAYCDRGYRGVKAEIGETKVHLTNKRKGSLTRSAWRWLRRRAAIEPVIGHLKSDTRLDRNYLLGEEGDRINAILSGCGFNVRKLLRAFFLFLLFWFDSGSTNPTEGRLPLLSNRGFA
jgi:transposase, IS5 family